MGAPKDMVAADIGQYCNQCADSETVRYFTKVPHRKPLLPAHAEQAAMIEKHPKWKRYAIRVNDIRVREAQQR
jgi:hypothetical protein